MRQAIEYLSIHMEKQETKQEKLENKLNEQCLKYDKIASDSEMKYNIIRGLCAVLNLWLGSPNVSTSSVKEGAAEEDTMQQAALALLEQPNVRGN